jgi:hypothetical protein
MMDGIVTTWNLVIVSFPWSLFCRFVRIIQFLRGGIAQFCVDIGEYTMINGLKFNALQEKTDLTLILDQISPRHGNPSNSTNILLVKRSTAEIESGILDRVTDFQSGGCERNGIFSLRHS